MLGLNVAIAFLSRDALYSAKRGIAIACLPSVRLFVTSVHQDHIGNLRN